MDADKRILEEALKAVSLQLNALVAECLDEAGKPKAPSMRELMKSRAALPPYCNMTFKR